MRMMKIIPFLLTFLLLTPVAFAADPAAKVGVASAVDGEPKQLTPNLPERTLKVGNEMVANEKIITTTNDRAHVVFLDGSALSIGPGSAITIDKFVYDPAARNGTIAMTATKGAFRFVGGAISKKSEVKITTPSASMGIRGGIATFTISESGVLTANFLYGISLTITSQGVTQTLTQPGTQVVMQQGSPPPPPTVIRPGQAIPTALFESTRTATPQQRAAINTAITPFRRSQIAANVLQGAGPLQGVRQQIVSGPLIGGGPLQGSGPLQGLNPLLGNGPLLGSGPLMGLGPLAGVGPMQGAGPLQGADPLISIGPIQGAVIIIPATLPNPIVLTSLPTPLPPSEPFVFPPPPEPTPPPTPPTPPQPTPPTPPTPPTSCVTCGYTPPYNPPPYFPPPYNPPGGNVSPN